MLLSRVVHASHAIWHRRLGHLYWQLLQTTINKNSLQVSFCSLNYFCKDCQLGKFSKLSLLLTNNKSNIILDLIFIVVWGLSPLSSDGHRYVVIFVDHFSKYIWFYPFTQKSDIFHVFLKFFSMVECQFGSILKSV